MYLYRDAEAGGSTDPQLTALSSQWATLLEHGERR
jgi:hypothetical protein